MHSIGVWKCMHMHSPRDMRGECICIYQSAAVSAILHGGTLLLYRYYRFAGFAAEWTVPQQHTGFQPGRRQAATVVAVVVETIGCGGTPDQESRGGDAARSGAALVRGFNDSVVRAAACCPVWPARCRASTICAPAMSMQCGNTYTQHARKHYRRRDQKYQAEGVRVSFGGRTGCFVLHRVLRATSATPYVLPLSPIILACS